MEKILLIETRSKTYDNLIFALNNYLPSCEILFVSSSKKCLELLGNEASLDIIILETGISDINVFELIKKIRDNSDIPILVVSHDNNIRTLVKAFDYGVNDYIVMPISNDVLIAILKAIKRRVIWDRETTISNKLLKQYI